MAGFVIFFQQKEGSTALVEQLGMMPGITIVRAGEAELEPFDEHASGNITTSVLAHILDGIFQRPPAGPEITSRLYSRSSGRSLNYDPHAKAIGFKMRFRPRRDYRSWLGPLSKIAPLARTARNMDGARYQVALSKLFRRHEVTVFVLIRRDVLRWALSSYHGDGTGKEGHLQFKLASGEIKRSDIGKIQVDPDRLARVIQRCQKHYQKKQRLMQRFERDGVKVFPIFYEDFTGDRISFYRGFFERLGLTIQDEEILAAVQKGTLMQKVHSDDISTFVINHEEIMARFGNVSSPWTPVQAAAAKI